jgi:IS30 family transposase
VLLTLTNRKNNDEVIMKLPNRTKPSIVTALNTLEKLLGAEKFNDIFTYIIFDNGIEFRDVDGIENSCCEFNIKRTKIFFARPYKSND